MEGLEKLRQLKLHSAVKLLTKEMKAVTGGYYGSGSGSGYNGSGSGYYSGGSGSGGPMTTGSDWTCSCIVSGGATLTWGCCGGPEDACARKGDDYCATSVYCFFRT